MDILNHPERSDVPVGGWEQHAHNLTAARKNARTDDDAAAIAWAQDEIARLTKMVRHASSQGVTFPPDTLPRVAGAETIVVCPVCKKEWKFDDHDNCPTCGLIPQGVK